MTAAPSISEDARFRMTMLASGTERRNRPRWILAVALAALLLAAGTALVSAGRRSRAAARLDDQRTKSAQVASLIDRLEALRSAPVDPMAEQEGGRIDTLLSNIENYAIQAFMKDKPKQPNQRSEQKADVVINTYTYSEVRDDSIEALLEWVQMVDERVPGMQVSSMILKPDGKGWKITVSFRRWERKGA